MLWTSLLALLLLNPIGFGLCFHFYLSMHILISFLISSVICWLFRSVFFSLQMFVIFYSFFSCGWYLILQHCNQKRCLKWFQFVCFWVYQGRFMAQDVIYPGECSVCTAEKRWILLLLGEIPYRYQLGLTSPMYHLKLCFLVNFLSGWYVHWCECGIKVPYY